MALPRRHIWPVLTRIEYARRAGRGRTDARVRVIAIIGMHRSGTSAFTGTLQRGGLFLGDVVRKGGANQKGSRESREITKLHDEILAHSGGTWSDPPASITWTNAHRRHRDQIIDSFANAGMWGFKDPRTVLLPEFWRETLGDSLRLAGIFREPRGVAASLLARHGGSSEKWFALWVHYNRLLLQENATNAFPLVEFVLDTDCFHRQVVPVLHTLGLREPRWHRFFDPTLSAHATERSEPTCAPAAELLEELRFAARAFRSLTSR
jgi:hypothetical protein